MWFDARKALEEIEGGSAPPLDSTRPNDAAKPEFVAMSQLSQHPTAQKNEGDPPEFVAESQLSQPTGIENQPYNVENTTSNVAIGPFVAMSQLSQHPTAQKTDTQQAQRKAHGVSFGGRPKTWTGRVVSLDAWRALSEWERHGSSGQSWNGAKRQWEQPKGAPND